VLVCPDCQNSRDWVADLDRCARCDSTRLVRRLGEVECRDCGFVAEPAEAGPGFAVGPAEGGAGPGPAGRDAAGPGAAGNGAGSDGAGSDGAGSDGAAAEPSGLAEEVSRALERVLGRRAGAEV
jgi:rubredoxin